MMMYSAVTILTTMLLCDFHIHTTFLRRFGGAQKDHIDLFGQAGFDVIAITDHVVNGDNPLGKLAHRFKYSVTAANFGQYLSHIKEEAERAREKYGMLVIPGIEITKNHLSTDNSAHMLIIDVQDFIPACMSYEEIFLEAKKQNALTIACHPHYMSAKSDRDTLFSGTTGKNMHASSMHGK